MCVGRTLQSVVRALRRRPSFEAIRRCRRTSESSRYGSFLLRGHSWGSGRAVRVWRVAGPVFGVVSGVVRAGVMTGVMALGTAMG